MAWTLIYDQVGTHPPITSEWPWTHIWSCENTSHSHIRMAVNPRLRFPGNWLGASILPENGNLEPRWVFLVTDQVPPFQEWHLALTYDHVGTNPIVTSEWISTHIWHVRNQMAQPLHLTMEGTNPLAMLEWLSIFIIFSWRKPQSREHQASPWSTQTSL